MSKPSRNPSRNSPTTTPGAPSRPAFSSSRSATAPRSPLQRYRRAIIGVAVAAVVLVGGAFLFLGASAPAYACSTVLAPSPAPSAGPDATPRLGQVTRDLGRAHVETGSRVTYEFCPPTSGVHYNGEPDGPIPTRFYSSKETALPQGWIHNLEHGQMVVLYRCPEGCADFGPGGTPGAPGADPGEPALRLPGLGFGGRGPLRRPADTVRRARLGARLVPRCAGSRRHHDLLRAGRRSRTRAGVPECRSGCEPDGGPFRHARAVAAERDRRAPRRPPRRPGPSRRRGPGR